MVAWNVGYSVGLGLVAVVVVLLVILIVSASQAAAKAEAISVALAQSRDNTEGLASLATTNKVATRIVVAAGAARRYLASKTGVA